MGLLYLDRIHVGNTGTDLIVIKGYLVLPLVSVESVKSWNSSHEKVARIDENGVLTTYQSGYSTITMKDGDLTEFIELPVRSHIEYNIGFNVSGTWNGGLNGEIIISNYKRWILRIGNLSLFMREKLQIFGM